MYVSVLVYRTAETYADDVETLLQKDVTDRQTDGQRTFTRLFIKYRIQTIGIHGVYTQSDSPEGSTRPAYNLGQLSELDALGRWRRGIVVSGVRRMNARRARLVPGWVTVFGRVYHLGM